MSNREKRENRNKYMENYKKGKNSHYIALNDRMTEKENFLIRIKPNLKWNEIYERGLDSYLEEYKKSGSQLKYRLQEITNKKEKLKQKLAEYEVTEKEINRELNDIENKKMENRLKHFIKDVEPLFERFSKNNDSFYFKDFYEPNKEKIWHIYTKSSFTNETLDNTFLDDSQRDDKMMEILMSKLDYSFNNSKS